VFCWFHQHDSLETDGAVVAAQLVVPSEAHMTENRASVVLIHRHPFSHTEAGYLSLQQLVQELIVCYDGHLTAWNPEGLIQSGQRRAE